ncbi:hypothetical protein [Geminicoccus harenae]|uniref:hypothetical protein n=1 Tax=Geminicoccus harenae TaxID=2498453 RepID=UPI00168AF51A|nr:hypothetical protein [Geminicoccus harenae]
MSDIPPELEAAVLQTLLAEGYTYTIVPTYGGIEVRICRQQPEPDHPEKTSRIAAFIFFDEQLEDYVAGLGSGVQLVQQRLRDFMQTRLATFHWPSEHSPDERPDEEHIDIPAGVLDVRS